MLKKTFILVLVLAMLVSATAMAEVTNRDMQLMGGVVVSNASDSFFFAPMEEGMTKHWGLYALSKASEGPLVEIQDGYPARLIHADNERVYFFGYTDAERSVHALYSVEIATQAYEELLTDIKDVFVGETADEFLYTKSDNPYTLRSYNLTEKKDKSVKDMSKSDKTIYDAGIYDGRTYFITRTTSGAEDGYEYHEGSGKATNLDKPSPQLLTGMLYEGYRLYVTDQQGIMVYAVKLGNKNANQLGAAYAVSLKNPRFGEYIYTYGGDNNELIALPLDGSEPLKLKLEGSTLVRMVLGGSKDQLMLINDNAIYGITPNLTSQTKLIDFDQRTGGQAWSHVAPAGSNAIMVFGYGQDTLTSASNLMPTGVYAYDKTTGDMLFGFPEWDPNAEPAEPAETSNTRPETIGAPNEEKEEGETYFVFSSGG